LYASMSTTGS